MRLKLNYIVLDRKDQEILTAIRIQHPPNPSEFNNLGSKLWSKFSHFHALKLCRSLILFQPSVVPLCKNMLRTKLNFQT